MANRVYFITAFLTIDYTENPETITALERCWNCFYTEEAAMRCLKEIQLRIKQSKKK